MQKKITVYVCDVCDDEMDDSEVRICEVCKKEVCDSCSDELLEADMIRKKPFIICSKCGDNIDWEKEMKKFAKDKEVQAIEEKKMDMFRNYVTRRILVNRIDDDKE